MQDLQQPATVPAIKHCVESELLKMFCLQVLDRLPIVDIRWKAPQLKTKKGSEEGQPAIQEYELDVQLKRLAGKKGGAGLARVYAPRFPKVGLSVLYCLESECNIALYFYKFAFTGFTHIDSVVKQRVRLEYASMLPQCPVALGHHLQHVQQSQRSEARMHNVVSLL